jgi:alkyl hydroperoxide reductase subunit AhpC
MSILNTEIKPFEATAFRNGMYVDVSSEDVRGKWSIFFFYPADFTFVCPTELGDMADLYDEFTALGVEVYAVSTDTHHVHAAWHKSSDTIGKIRYFMVGDPSGVISRYWITPEGVGRNAAELLRKVKAAQYVRNHPGEVCPAKWEEGEETLAPSIDLVGKI